MVKKIKLSKEKIITITIVIILALTILLFIANYHAYHLYQLDIIGGEDLTSITPIINPNGYLVNSEVTIEVQLQPVIQGILVSMNIPTATISKDAYSGIDGIARITFMSPQGAGIYTANFRAGSLPDVVKSISFLAGIYPKLTYEPVQHYNPQSAVDAIIIVDITRTDTGYSEQAEQLLVDVSSPQVPNLPEPDLVNLQAGRQIRIEINCLDHKNIQINVDVEAIKSGFISQTSEAQISVLGPIIIFEVNPSGDVSKGHSDIYISTYDSKHNVIDVDNIKIFITNPNNIEIERLYPGAITRITTGNYYLSFSFELQGVYYMELQINKYGYEGLTKVETIHVTKTGFPVIWDLLGSMPVMIGGLIIGIIIVYWFFFRKKPEPVRMPPT